MKNRANETAFVIGLGAAPEPRGPRYKELSLSRPRACLSHDAPALNETAAALCRFFNRELPLPLPRAPGVSACHLTVSARSLGDVSLVRGNVTRERIVHSSFYTRAI